MKTKFAIAFSMAKFGGVDPVNLPILLIMTPPKTNDRRFHGMISFLGELEHTHDIGRDSLGDNLY